MMDPIDLTARILFWACALPAVLFVFFYGVFSRWWITDIGRIIMGLCAALVYMTGLSLARYVTDGFPGEDMLRVVGYLAINAGLWHMVWTLRRIQSSTRTRPKHRKNRKKGDT